MRKFKSAAELGISPEEREALIEVAGFLRDQNPDRVADPEGATPGEPVLRGEIRFDMDIACEQFTCGTALCVGGLAKLRMMGRPLSRKIEIDRETADEIDQYVKGFMHGSVQPIWRLYYPHGSSVEQWSELTAEQGAGAIERFLEGNRHPWIEI